MYSKTGGISNDDDIEVRRWGNSFINTLASLCEEGFFDYRPLKEE